MGVGRVVQVNMMVSPAFADMLDDARGARPRGVVARDFVEEWAAKGGGQPQARPDRGPYSVMVTIFVRSAILALIDKEREGEPRSSFIRRLLLSSI